MDDRAHFGLGAAARIDSLRITWPDGRSSLLTDIPADQTLRLAYEGSAAGERTPLPFRAPPVFREAGAQYGIQFRHQEKDAVDYNIQPTLPHKLSQYGPGIAVGDVDNNGFEDFYIGGSTGYPGIFYMQDAAGQFAVDADRIVQEDNMRTEETGVLLFDADNDGDLDLYAVCGSYEFAPNHPGNQDRLYRNNGQGRFQWDRAALPEETGNGACVRAADFDGDGDLDLFVGGRSVSGSYPLAPRSALLKNEGGRFTDATAQWCPQLQNPGMVTDALWSDFDGDGKVDLVLAGEWMPVSFFKNEGSVLRPVATGTEQQSGWWNSLAAGDFDNDGDIDYVAGNLGLNSNFRATPSEPMLIYAKDLDENGKLDPMVFCYIRAEDGTRKPFPMHTKDDLSSQLVSIRKKYPTYKSYGRASLNELWSPQDRQSAVSLKANHLASSFLENRGNGRFSVRPLPPEAQVAPVYGMVPEDVDADGLLDLLLVGNDYGMEPGSGRHDALSGLCLKGDGRGGFRPLTVAESGFFVNGDAKGLARIRTAGNEDLLLATQNADSLLVFRRSAQGNNPQRRYVTLQADECSVDLVYSGNRKRRTEIYYGATFLSQSSRSLPIDREVVKVIVTNYKGQKREITP